MKTDQNPRKPTLKQLLEKFSNLDTNSNCLTDMICPECGNRRSFKIQMTSMFTLLDEGTDEYGDTEWDGKSYCECTQCQNAGKVKKFTFQGLDAAIATKSEKS